MGNVVIDYAFTFKNYTHNLFWSNTGHSCGGGGGGGLYIPNTINSDFQELRRGHIGGSTFHLDNYNKNLKKVKTSGGGGGDGGYENDMKRHIQCTRKTPTALAKIGLNSCRLLYKNK